MTKDIILLDGGMGQELVHRAGDRPTALWSTQVMMDHPGLVTDIHRDYCDAGATIATTNTYAIHRDRLASAGVPEMFETLHTAALTEAANIDRPGTQIAGAIGPLIASYRPDIHPTVDAAIPLYAEVARILAQTCDILICETVASVDHAKAVLAASKQTGKPVMQLPSAARLTRCLPIVHRPKPLVRRCRSLRKWANRTAVTQTRSP